MKIKNLKNIPSLSLGLLLFTGCAVGPNYTKPVVKAPSQWSGPLAGGETENPAVVSNWWKNFNDPELDSLVGRAAKSNFDLKIAEARVREARAQSGGAAADLWPTVDASGSYARDRESQHQPVLGSLPVPPGTPFTNNVYQAGFDASWEIDVFGGKRRAVESAQAQVAAAEFSQRDVLVTLLGEVARNYIDVRGNQRRLEIARENIHAQEQSLAIARDRYAHGLTGDLDVEQAATLLAITQAEVPALETAIQASIHRLGVLLGQPPEALQTELAAVAPIPAAPPAVPVGLPSELLLHRPDVQQAERQLASATAAIGVAQADWFPKFYLTGAGGFQSVGTGDWFTPGSRFWSLGPTMQWNLFDAGRIRANVKVKNAQQEEALANYEKTTLGAFEDVENALVAYAKEQVRRRSLEQAVRSSQASLALADKLYANGLTGFINVLDAERSLYQAQDALVQSDQTVSTDVVALYKSLGGGWEKASLTTASRQSTEKSFNRG
ncbi:MAG: efflux transporter outer membrane subunit [Opitutaceae bacterium]|jgi:NodT family efflux transporter outer membrane factor (OMF) lipoprotein